MTQDPFIFDAGNRALDLLNTRWLSGGRPVDRLMTPEDAAAWLTEAGLVEPDDGDPPGPRERQHWLADLRALRDAAAAAVDAFTRGAPPPAGALSVVNDVLATRRYVYRLEREGAAVRRIEVADTVGASGVVAPVAEALADLLGNADPARVRQCDDDTCVLWFLDTTRNGSRRWCSMARCGNRAKSATHYRRHRARPA